jgi:autotransporter-associated beta strand protein
VVDYANGVSIANAIIINSNTTQLSVTSGSATQAGAISELNGPRPLEKIGAGTLVLSGISTYSGPTTISGGALMVTGSIGNSALTIGNGATLTGTGTVGATTIASGGTFAPGPVGTPGAMTVNGNLAFQSGAIYAVQVNPVNASSANAIAGGSASLAGTVQAAFATGSYVTRNYTILSAAGGVSGTFGGLTTSNLPAGFTANLGYTANSVLLNLTATLGQPIEPTGPTGPGALRATALSGNQLGIANALNAFFNNGGALPPSFVSIFGLTGGNLANALTSLSGEAATGAQQAGLQMGSQFLSLMLDPFVDGRSGVAGASTPALGFAPEQEPVPQQVALAYAKVLAKEPKPAPLPLYEPRWNVWGGAYGGGNKTSGDPAVLGSHDLSATTAGFAAGLDYRLSPNSVVGLALAGGGTNWSLAQGLGGGKSDAFQAGLYGATRSGPAYLAAAFAFTTHWMSTDRLAFAGDHLTASFNAQSYGGRLEGGYRFAMWYGGVTPYAAIQAQNFHTPGYSETGVIANGFALAFNGRDASDTRSELGARFDRALALYTDAVLSFRGRVAWAHDWISDPSLTPLFLTLPGASFVVNGATPAKDSALLSAGTEYRLANGVTLLAKFDGEFASHSSTYAGTGALRYAW